MTRRDWAEPLAAGLAVAAYTGALVHYGLYAIAEEGLLLAQAWRTAHGQLPYVDFHTGYGPLYFRIESLLVASGGITAVRMALVAVHGLTAGLCYALTRRLASGAIAAAAVAVEASWFLPVAPRQGALFFVPYPAWYVGAAALGVALLLEHHRRRLVADALAGVLAGLALAMKQNAGAFFAAGAAVVMALDAPATPSAARLRGAVLWATVLGSMALIAPSGVTMAAWVLVTPVVGLVLLGGRPDGVGEPLGRRLASLIGGFSLAAGAAYLPSLISLGPAKLGRDLFLLGPSFAAAYTLPFPLAGGLVGTCGVMFFVVPARARAVRRILATVAALGLGLAAFRGATTIGRPGPLLSALEQVLIALVPLVLWGALCRVRGGSARQWLPPAALAVLATLQLYPRPDFEHLVLIAPILVPVGLALWHEAATRSLPAQRWAVAVAVLVPLGIATARLAPTALLFARLATGAVDQVRVGMDRLAIEPAGLERLSALGETAAFVREQTVPGDRVFTFPACAVVAFFADRSPAGPHDYFYPGRPSRAEGVRLVADLAAEPPPIAVTCDTGGTDLDRAWSYFPEIAAFLDARYRVALVRPPFLVWMRRSDPDPAAPETGRSDDAPTDESSRRRNETSLNKRARDHLGG